MEGGVLWYESIALEPYLLSIPSPCWEGGTELGLHLGLQRGLLREAAQNTGGGGRGDGGGWVGGGGGEELGRETCLGLAGDQGSS